MKSKSHILILLGLFSLTLGCSTTKHVQPDPQPVRLPQPFTLNFNTSLKIDLPEEMTKQEGTPSKILGEVKFSMTSTAFEADPIRSRYTGQITLQFSDLDQTHTYLDFTSDLNGEYDGKPSECLSLGFKQATGMITLLNQASNSINKEKTR